MPSGMTVHDWHPIDASGANLSIQILESKYIKLWNLIFLSASIIYPATSDGNAAKLSGLPVEPDCLTDLYSNCIGFTNLGTYFSSRVNRGSLDLSFIGPDGSALPNSILSSAIIGFTLIYLGKDGQS